MPSSRSPMPSSNSDGATGRAGAGRLTRALRSFGAFWLDFLVGDAPELLVGALVVIGAAALAVHQHAPRAVVIGAVPSLVLVVLFVSVAQRARARR
jgi:hypothetical protein